jgi:hypothetical protein
MQRLLLATACLTTAIAAPGKLVLDGKTYELSHVYARRSPNVFEPKKMTTYLLASDIELSAADRVDNDAIRELTWSGKMNAVEIELTDGGISWSILSSHSKMSMSGSKSPNPFALQVTADRIRGTVKMAAPEKLGDTSYYYEFPVDAVIEKKVEAPAPTAADKVAAQSAASTKAYQAYLVVLMKGDKAGLMKAVDPAKGQMMDTPEFPEMLKFIQSVQPKNITVLRATEAGDKAELIVSGNAGSETGTVKMQKINGAWIVMKESWKKR